MSRQPRVDVANEIYHVINRANARQQIFKTHQDYRATLIALQETLKKIPIEIFSYILMPNHWHFSVRPIRNGDMGKFFGKFTQKATQRWHASHQTAGSGHLFQGPYKAVHVEQNYQLLHLSAYIHKNPTELAEWRNKISDYPWSSLQDFSTKNRWDNLIVPNIILEQFKTNGYQKFLETSTAKNVEHSVFNI